MPEMCGHLQSSFSSPSWRRIFRSLCASHAETDSRGPLEKKKLWGGLSVLALAAVVVLAVFLPARIDHESSVVGPSLVVRSSNEHDPAVPLAPVNTIVNWRARDDLELTWTPSDPAAPVVVEIFDGDGELIWTGHEMTDSRLRWPTEIAEQPSRFYWRVVSLSPVAGRVPSDLVSVEFVTD